MPAQPQIDWHRSDLYLNRHLSWLEFNQRVLDQAAGDDHPLLERVKFLAIVSSNLDEFFMVRVAALLRAQRRRRLEPERRGRERLSLDGLTDAEQLAAVRKRVASLMRDQAACWRNQLRPALAEAGIRFLEPDEYTETVRNQLHAYFRTEVYPLLTPLAFDPSHPFPLISNQSKNVAVVVRHNSRTKFARVKVPTMLPRFIPLPKSGSGSESTFAYLEDVIRLNLADLFPDVEITGAHLFRVLRDNDIESQEDEGPDLMESVHRNLKELQRGDPALLQVEASMPRRVLNLVVQNFDIEHDIVVRSADRIDFSDWLELTRLPRPDLKDAPLVRRMHWAPPPQHACVFDDIRGDDHLVHHPFDAFSAVEAFVHQASTDPRVVAIKTTLYRVGNQSSLVDMLVDAAEAGKQVAVLVELKARFDERKNIKWATRLEDAGVHVVYGLEDLKVHCKLCLVVRRDATGVRRYAHIGTGNYNAQTARTYTDVGLFTSDPDIVDDVSEVFNYLTGYSRRTDYKQLLVAPVGLRKRLIALVEREAGHAQGGRPARVIMKVNSLSDSAIIRSLYRASQAGVEIDLIVRGICCLRPGVPGLSDRIRVRSIVGRYLEHSRLFYFGNDGNAEMYFGSADLMERNLDRRVEVLCPVRDVAIMAHLRDIVLEAYLTDTRRAYELTDSRYTRATAPPGVASIDSQALLEEWYPKYERPDAPFPDNSDRTCSDSPERQD